MSNHHRNEYQTTIVEPSDGVRLESYEPHVGSERVESLRRLAEPLRGMRWAHLNSTADGGGVAEMIRSIVPLARALGVDTSWHVLRGDDEFFQVTKKFHNLLQGVDQPISMDEIMGTYLDTIMKNGHGASIEADLIVVHDPQPIGLVAHDMLLGNVVWRCHIDTYSPDQTIWRFLLPYINQCDGAIFTMPEFVGAGVRVPQYEISPCIDPLTAKNQTYSRENALDVLSTLFDETNVDPERPIFAAISRYDIHKNQTSVLRAFQKMRDEHRPDPAPYLIFLGNTATDDPEGGTVLGQLTAEAGNDRDVRFWVNVDDNDRVVGALNTIARAVVHVSTREGFGLVVSEALWQGTPVIGSRTGGIVKQVIDGDTGRLVDAGDVDAIAASMAHMLEQPEAAEALGRRGRELVRERFLLPELLRRHLVLLRYYAGIDRAYPDFRLNGTTHLDRRNVYRSRYIHPKSGSPDRD